MQRLRKIHVSTGLYWVEAPDAGVYILCGCPPDSVKHMMKRGLIVPTESDGATYETGPNVILLSDVMLQNGAFANMGEFPVLQMLYRQGMILPGHPNNTGVKPMIVGSEPQVSAQLSYIYRGNYGLTSEAELVAAGATPAEAEELMQMKLKFAFGKIRDSGDFLDTRVVADDRVEIRDGVSVRRLALNVFEFDYDGESITVDLNLAPGESYQCAYPLGFHRIKREYFAVIHSGEGDGWDINRPDMSSILMFHGKIYLIDAGPSIINTLMALGIGVNEVEGIFHTHSHDDHFAGLPALIRTDKRIKYFASGIVRASVAKKLAALLSIDEEDFAHYFEVHDLAFDEWNNIEGLEVRPTLSPHPVETSVFLFRALWDGGYKTYAHQADIASFKVLDGMVRKTNSDIGISQQMCDRTKVAYLEPTDLKKLDIGGGMIHGAAEDFRGDKSKKIVLAHTSLELTDEQKEIGSSAPFGTIDVLIPSYQDYGLRGAFQFLRDDFTGAPVDQLRMILNNETIAFNPGTIVVKEGEINEQLYLILSGYVDMIQSRKKVRSVLYAGTMVGELSALNQTPSLHTYRAASFVHALRISSSLYRDFIRVNHLHHEIERLKDGWNFLQETWLFSEAISYTTLNNLSETLGRKSFTAGQMFDLRDDDNLHIVKNGRVERIVGGKVVERLESGDFFGEEAILGGNTGKTQFRITDDTDVYCIGADMLRDIPICRWKLFETSGRRARLS